MVKIVAAIDIYGVEFEPIKASKQLGVIFNNITETGELGTKGRFKNKPIPYGSASIKPPIKTQDYNRITWLINFLMENIEVLKDLGGEDISISVAYYHDGQCNCELTLEELKGLAKLYSTRRF